MTKFTRLAITCSMLYTKRLIYIVKCVQSYYYKHLSTVSRSLILSKFYIIILCFHCKTWTGDCLLVIFFDTLNRFWIKMVIWLIYLPHTSCLTRFMALVSFYTPLKHQKTRCFLMFSGGIERELLHKWIKGINLKRQRCCLLKYAISFQGFNFKEILLKRKI